MCLHDYFDFNVSYLCDFFDFYVRYLWDYLDFYVGYLWDYLDFYVRYLWDWTSVLVIYIPVYFSVGGHCPEEHADRAPGVGHRPPGESGVPGSGGVQ